MQRFSLAIAIALLVVLPAAAQQDADVVQQAQAVLHAAEQAGARSYATTLYDEAAYRLRFAQENWTAKKSEDREQARVMAIEGLWAARAALAKANWIGTNDAIRNLQTDIRRLGGRSDVSLSDEPATISLARGTTSAQRIAFAQAALDQAKAAGGASVAADDLTTAQKNLDSARKVTKGGGTNSAADYLAYTAEMMARRAYYLARANDASKQVTPLQLSRTQLAQAETERQAAVERAQREAAERQSAELQRQLAAEQSNRQAQQAELDRLRSQIAETEAAQQARIDADRAARAAAEKALSDIYARYEAAIMSGTPTDVETLRRQLEDQQLQLNAIQDRERMSDQQMSVELESMRTELMRAQQQGGLDAQLLAQRQTELQQRQTELETMRKDREAEAQRLIALQQQHANAIADAQMKRQQAEAQAQELKAQAEAAQKAAMEAQAAAAQLRMQAEATQRQNEATQAELARTRQQLAERDADARRMKMEAELARLASTRSDKRGFIVALSGGLLFDTGKSTLKAGAKSTLTKIADQLKTNPDAKVSVEGHTDSVGTEAKNQELSQKRADAVRDFLVNAGLSSDHLMSSGKGEGEPIATNKTAAGRQQNRRVELVITQ
jgi:outer membrane protein OmpA-like peptidoglycan-associated protein